MLAEALAAVDERTLEILERRRPASLPRSRGWLVRRMLLIADVAGLSAAFTAAVVAVGTRTPTGAVNVRLEFLLFFVTLPGWIVLAKLHGLYERDEERADHTTVDDVVGVFHLVTVGAWLFFLCAWVTGFATPQFTKLAVFWILAIVLVTGARSLVRGWCRCRIGYVQNTIVVGAGETGQLIARKLVQHPEYGLNVVGFVDRRPRERRADLDHLALLGPPERLPELVRLFDVERVVIAFSNDTEQQTLELIRPLRDLDVQIDIVPRLYELVGPKVGVHSVETLPLVGLPPARLSRSSWLIKRTIDVCGSLIGLVLTAPLFAFIAWQIKRDTPGPVFFRQARLGLSKREFTALKFRTMKVGTDDSVHRAYIRSTMTARAIPGSNGLYKLEREDAVTRVGRWLRRTSLDELPQLINVLRGEMSLVGPRPCLRYETESFAPHHFERFLVPAGITGLWQVAARANSTFGEALDMDVAYARGWSLGLDLRLLARTPFQLLRQRRATA
jgi:exopolysaccharide biosynthesis polyprenyl glycosylphosphotransferase